MSAYIHATGILSQKASRTTKNGDPFTTAKLEVTQQNGWRVTYGLRAFGDLSAKIADVRDGAVVTVTGPLTQSKNEKDGKVYWNWDIQVNEIIAGFVPNTPAPTE